MKKAVEILVPHPANVGPVTQLRSTLLQSSLTALRERGHFDTWAAAVSPAHRATIVESVGPTWLPIAVGEAHYAACDAMQLPQSELTAMGEAVGARVQATFLGTVSRAAQQAGMNPWAAVPHAGRLWPRVFTGGSHQISKLGPKDVQVEVKGLSLVRFTYFRHAYAGLLRAGLLLFGARSAYVSMPRWLGSTGELVLQAAWA